MTKILSILLFGLLALNIQAGFTREVVKHQVNTDNTYNVSDEYNFNDSSNYLTDEQLQAAQEIDEIDDKSSFGSKIINSSHFSSSTATKTWIPINKVK